jgi:hypothetical protein
MATTEHTINDALAAALRGTRRVWRAHDVVASENTGKLRGSTKRPDILIAEPHVSPVVIETEVVPATTVESDACSRLGERLATTGRTILSSIAVRLPAVLRQRQGEALQEAIRESEQFQMALYTGQDSSNYSRLPTSGWLSGGITDLSILAQHASVPPAVIDQAADVLMDGISTAARLLGDAAESHPGAVEGIGVRLRQRDDPQTRSMAMAILANALVFHEGLAGGPGRLGKVRSLAQLRGGQAGLSRAAVLGECRKILAVNYWPIFDIARRILEVMPSPVAREIVEGLADTADQLSRNRLMRSHDLTGAVFQRLIADRRFLAAYYTTPAASALLAGLAITPTMLPAGLSWFDGNDLGQLRIGDLACGTGTLVSTAYQRIGQLHEVAGGDAEALHPVMMEGGLVGCDVLPAASHLTASMLAGAHPTVTYQRSAIYTVAYGKQPGDTVALGSIDLLDENREIECLAITSQSADPTGESDVNARLAIPHKSFHLVIMNPPFTRPTGHAGERKGVPNPMFAAFGSRKEEQRRMGKAMKVRTRGSCYHGNAGEASAFLPLANRKLKTEGVLALVMPLGLLAGDSWEASRKVIANGYTDIVVVSIASPEDGTVAFSADTRTADCLIVGRKVSGFETRPARRAVFVMLTERPAYPLVGAEIARQIRRLIDGGQIRRLEDGPVGGALIKFGDVAVGHALDSPLPESGSWYLSRIIDQSLAQTAYQLAAMSRVWLPGTPELGAHPIPMAKVEKVGEVGPYHADINGTTQGGGVRGPFEIVDVAPGTVPTYPVLWNHDADRERTMLFEGDSEGRLRVAADPQSRAAVDEKRKRVWASASHCHLNRDFRFNSQSTAMQFTSRRTIGGYAWPSVSLETPEQEKVLVLWGNTTFGLLMYWWHASRQQTGRGRLGVKSARTLPVLDVRRLPPDRLARGVRLFDSQCTDRLLPINEMGSDPARQRLDDKFSREVLGLDESLLGSDGPLALLRKKLASEPSVHEGKLSRVGAARRGAKAKTN